MLSLAVRVVPEIPSFAVDDGFRYAVPEALGRINVGSVVRVILGGRRVRGYVVEVGEAESNGRVLKDVAGLSGNLPVFDDRLLRTLRWLATYYVAPVGVVLARAAPPNLPRELSVDEPPPAPEGPESPLSEATRAAAAGKRTRPQYLVTRHTDSATVAGLVGAVCRAGRSAIVVLPTVAETEAMARDLEDTFGSIVLSAHSGRTARKVTGVWTEAATRAGRVLVGTREVALWPVHRLALTVVIEEGRRAMKSPQTPTAHVRDILRRRAAIERFQLVFVGPVPTLETVAAGFDITEPAGRVWPLVEVVDRSEDPPGSGFVSMRARRALKIVHGRGGLAFVLVNRRGYAPAFRCLLCRSVRRCGVCEAAADRGDICRRCSGYLGVCAICEGSRFEPLGAGVGRIVDELRAVLGTGVGATDGDTFPVAVGTERDLPSMGSVDLAIVVDADGVILAPHYRAGEEALRLLARLAGKVRSGPGRRAIVQTGMPSHPVLSAVRSGHPMDFLRSELESRVGSSFPPATELMAVEIAGDAGGVTRELRRVVSAEVLGPAGEGTTTRWLVQGSDLSEAKVRMRPMVQQWRDRGLRVRIDVDPQDL